MAFSFYRHILLVLSLRFNRAPSNAPASLILLDSLYMLGKSTQPLNKESSGYLSQMVP